MKEYLMNVQNCKLLKICLLLLFHLQRQYYNNFYNAWGQPNGPLKILF